MTDDENLRKVRCDGRHKLSKSSPELETPVMLRVCDFFDVVKNRGCKQNSYDDKLVINSKESQTLSRVAASQGEAAKQSKSGAPSEAEGTPRGYSDAESRGFQPADAPSRSQRISPVGLAEQSHHLVQRSNIEL
jgi:hypothetical protein